MNETINTLINRRSCKKFKSQMVSEEDINLVIKAGEYAPNGKGAQSAIIIAITNKELRDKLSNLNREIAGMKEGIDPFYNAPVVLVVLAKKSIGTHVYDGSLVIGNMLNAAASLGLGSCWIHRAKEEFESPIGQEILRGLGISEEYEGIGHCILGYPDGNTKEASPRKEDFVYYIK